MSIIRPDTGKLGNLNPEHLKAEVKPMEKREKWVIGIFFAVVAAWVLPEFLKNILPSVSTFFSSKGTTFPPMLGAIAMFMISINGKPLLNFKEAMRSFCLRLTRTSHLPSARAGRTPLRSSVTVRC